MLSEDEKEITELMSKTMMTPVLKEFKDAIEQNKKIGEARYQLTQKKLDDLDYLIKDLLNIAKEIRRNGNHDT